MANKRSLADFSGGLHSTPEPKRNAFANMMSATWKSSYPVFEPEESDVSSITLESWSEMLENKLEYKRSMLHTLSEGALSGTVISSIIETTDATIINRPASLVNLQMKLSDLHAFIDISTGIAFAPSSVVMKEVRESSLPSYFIDNIYRILDKMVDYEIKRVISEKSFVRKVKELRYTTCVCWNEKRWQDLDEVLRLVKHSGPVGFRFCYKKAQQYLEWNHGLSSTGKYIDKENSIIKIIRNEVSAYVTRESCYETKFNALNALADIGMALLEKGSSYIVWGPLSAALLRIGKVLTEKDRHRMAENVSMNLLNEFSGTKLEMMLILRSLLEMRAVKDKNVIQNMVWRELCCYESTEMMALFEEGEDRSQSQEGSLIMKILYLRWTKSTRDEWDPTPLDEVLDLFINTTEPINSEVILKRAETAIDQFTIGYYRSREETARFANQQFHQALVRVSRRIDYRACFETKMNAFKTLVKIGILMTNFVKSCKDHRGVSYYSSHSQSRATESLLVNSMVRICQSLGNADLEKMLANVQLRSDILELGQRKIPGTLSGLYAVLALVQDILPEQIPNQSIGFADRRIVDINSDGVDILDLTLTSDGVEVVDLT